MVDEEKKEEKLWEGVVNFYEIWCFEETNEFLRGNT